VRRGVRACNERVAGPPGRPPDECGRLSAFRSAPLPPPARRRSSPPGAGSDDGVDERYARSVELPYQELRHAIISSGFTMLVRDARGEPRAPSALLPTTHVIIAAAGFPPSATTAAAPQKEGAGRTTYAANARSLMKVEYTTIQFVARKSGDGDRSEEGGRQRASFEVPGPRS
jgi:hypothetical protein